MVGEVEIESGKVRHAVRHQGKAHHDATILFARLFSPRGASNGLIGGARRRARARETENEREYTHS